MPEKMLVTARVPAKAATKDSPAIPELGPCTVEVLTGKDLNELKQMFGEKAIKTNAEANWVISIQSNIRSGLRKGETCSQIALRLRDAKMGIAQKGVQIDPVQAYLAKFQSATPEEQKKMIAELEKRVASASA